MIQAEKQRPVVGFEGRMEQSKRTPWTKKHSNKENAVFEQLLTPTSKNHKIEPLEKL